jgi:hypothetical protein
MIAACTEFGDRIGKSAIAAVVVEELDQGDRALRVSDHETVGRIIDRPAHVGDDLLARGVLGGLLLLVQRGDGVAQNLRMLHQIALDDALDLGGLVG